MTRVVEVVGSAATVREAARRMRDLNVGFLPVCDDAGNVLGLLTDRDIALRVVAEDLPPDTRVEDMMTDTVVSCRPEDDLAVAEELMRTNQVNRIVCLDEAGRLAGVVSLTDLAQYETAARAGEILSDITSRELTQH